MSKERVSRKELQAVAEDINKVLTPEPLLDAGNAPTEQLETEIRELIPEFKEDDPLSEETRVTLAKLEGKKKIKKITKEVKTHDEPKKELTNKKSISTAKSKFGHRIGSEGERIDLALSKTKTSLEQLAKETRLSVGRVWSHVKHLRDDTKIKMTIEIEKDKKLAATKIALV